MANLSFKATYPYQQNVLTPLVTDLDTTSTWYCQHFGMTEAEHHREPDSAVVLERNGVQRGFAINGGDASQDCSALLVDGLDNMRTELASTDSNTSDPRVDQNDAQSSKRSLLSHQIGSANASMSRLRRSHARCDCRIPAQALSVLRPHIAAGQVDPGTFLVRHHARGSYAKAVTEGGWGGFTCSMSQCSHTEVTTNSRRRPIRC